MKCDRHHHILESHAKKRNYSIVNRILLAIALGLLCVCGSGCFILQGALDKWDYDSRVDDYKDRGYSQRSAERNAYEDQFFDQMTQKAEGGP
jgi:hypothetical protein